MLVFIFLGMAIMAWLCMDLVLNMMHMAITIRGRQIDVFHVMRWTFGIPFSIFVIYYLTT